MAVRPPAYKSSHSSQCYKRRAAAPMHFARVHRCGSPLPSPSPLRRAARRRVAVDGQHAQLPNNELPPPTHRLIRSKLYDRTSGVHFLAATSLTQWALLLVYDVLYVLLCKYETLTNSLQNTSAFEAVLQRFKSTYKISSLTQRGGRPPKLFYHHLGLIYTSM